MSKLPHPIKYAEYVMEQMGFIQEDLVKFKCGTRGNISEMMSGKRHFSKRFIRNFLKAGHRENMAYILMQDYKLKS